MTNEELLVERLIRRIDQANTYFLKKIGSSIKQIRNLTPTQAHELVQMLKYGGSYEDVIKKIAQYTNLNISEIDEIFSSYAKQDREFYKQFYEYRNIPFEESSALKIQRLALTNLVKNEMYNFTRDNILGYTIDGKFYGLRDTYNKLLDEALLNVGQGKETFDSAMYRILKDIGGSGLRTINYQSGRKIRLDSAIKMHLKSRLRELHNENQKIIGEEIGSDGVEISVHENPAIDHEQAQGRQFRNEEYKKLQQGMEATDYTGKKITLDHDDKNGYRPISELNCYHYIFSIVLGVSEPEYTEKQLQEIIDKNNEGFELDGKHYTNYEGTQLQRNLERAIREQKDIQILAKASGNLDLVSESQMKITQLTRKYYQLSDISGLPTKMKRMRVSGYRRTKQVDNNPPKLIVNASQNMFDFEKYRNSLNNIETRQINEEFNFKGFVDEYNKFYNSLDKKEIEKVYGDYEKWIKTDMETSHPIGEYLNKKFKYDKKPELIDEKDYWIDEDGEPVLVYHDTTLLDENHWFRGIDSKNIENIKKYTDEFKNGDFFAGKGINGNGTYATMSYGYAESFGNDDLGGILYIMPKDNAKIVDIDKIVSIRSKLVKYIDSNDKLYNDFTTTILDDNGYIAQLLGYDIVNLGEHKIILNRGSIKVVK